MVVTTFPLKTVLQKLNFSRQMAKWALQLGDFDVNFQPGTSIKSQALADFVAKLTQLLEMRRWIRRIMKYGS